VSVRVLFFFAGGGGGGGSGGVEGGAPSPSIFSLTCRVFCALGAPLGPRSVSVSVVVSIPFDDPSERSCAS
jgi:hypothetical protein